MNIIKITPNKADAFLELLLYLDNETRFMMLEPGERKDTVMDLVRELSLDESKSIYLGIEEKDNLIGFINAVRGDKKRIKHTAYIVVGILNNYTGKGLGKKLFAEIDKWAVEQHVTRLELTVMTHNTGAIKLYEKMGFKREGIRKKSMIVNGQYVDEFYMAKLF